MISVVSPVYIAEEVVDELIKRLKVTLAPMGEYEIILIDDCSTDGSWERIKDAQGIRAYRNDKNIGQHATIQKGVELALGDWIVVMDCDLQDDPYEIPQLYAKATFGYDIIYVKRMNIKQSRIRRFCSIIFHHIYSRRKGITTDPDIANFAMYRAGYFRKTDCYITTVNVEHCHRYAGKSSYTLWKLVKLTLKFLK